MPDYINKVHNQLIKKFLIGTSARAKCGGNTIFTYMKLNDGFLFPIKM